MNTDSFVTILLAVGSWVVSGTITYGVMKTKIGDFERRLNVSEADHRELRRDFQKHQLYCAHLEREED